ncbi:MAG TPA: hypothetical protein VIY29_22395 [Ktedonobacteraceae bacterium]
MSSKTLYRLSGLALLLGSLLVVLFTIIQFGVFPGGTPDRSPDRYASPLWQPILLMMVLGLLLIVGGLPGMYARQAERAGWPGLIGFALTGFAMLLFGAFSALYAFVIPLLNTHAQLLLTGYDNFTLNGGRIPPLVVFFLGSVLVLSVGAFLLGLATIRAGVLPRAAGVALVVAGPAALALPLFSLLFFVPGLQGLGGLGDFLWTPFVVLTLTAFAAFFFGLARFGVALLSLQKVETVRPQPVVTEATS